MDLAVSVPLWWPSAPPAASVTLTPASSAWAQLTAHRGFRLHFCEMGSRIRNWIIHRVQDNPWKAQCVAFSMCSVNDCCTLKYYTRDRKFSLPTAYLSLAQFPPLDLSQLHIYPVALDEHVGVWKSLWLECHCQPQESLWWLCDVQQHAEVYGNVDHECPFLLFGYLSILVKFLPQTLSVSKRIAELIQMQEPISQIHLRQLGFYQDTLTNPPRCLDCWP